jgi:hypothetical protein
MANHDLGINEVLGATEGDEANLDHATASRRPAWLRGATENAPILGAGLFFSRSLGGLPTAFEIRGAAALLDDLVVLFAHVVKRKSKTMPPRRLPSQASRRTPQSSFTCSHSILKSAIINLKSQIAPVSAAARNMIREL